MTTRTVSLGPFFASLVGAAVVTAGGGAAALAGGPAFKTTWAFGTALVAGADLGPTTLRWPITVPYLRNIRIIITFLIQKHFKTVTVILRKLIQMTF